MRRFLLVWALAGCAFCGVAFAGAASAMPAAPPPGATARCNDGTYSFSQTHSGTCSYHGGVAVWLTPSGSGGTPSSSGGSTHVNVGPTVLLSRRTKTVGCTLGAEPDRRCSPGAYSKDLTKTVLCSSGFRTSSIRNVPTSEKHAVEQEYGLAPVAYGSALEIDHIVSLELGGSNDIANLFPEKANAHPGYRVKDKLENAAHAWVCESKIGLAATQRAIATNWEALYRRVFGTAPAG
ncbi:MAG TPA: DUF3761 domain-containing protein [Gaiellaceae bacterium]|nr:DUF3761 domain-containing protein [Gaiellaceae bacterium]